MKKKLKLKPCPFCGHDDITVEGKMKNFIYKDGTPMRGMWYDAQCEYCGCYLGPSPSMEMLVENWNRRAFEGTAVQNGNNNTQIGYVKNFSAKRCEE